MNCRRGTVIPALALLLAGAGLAAAETDGAGRNPFARPAVLDPPSARASAPAAPLFSLRATMAAGTDSLVNIEGRILRLGDELAGYRLVAVGEGTAVFVKNGIRYSLSIGQTSGDQG